MISISQEVTVGKKSCVFIRDVMGSALSDKYTKQAQSGQNVWYEEEVLVQVQEVHKGLPVYGLWQTLLASSLIDNEEVLQVVYTSANRKNGYYLFNNDGKYQTGTIFNGDIQSMPSAAVEQGLTLADAKEIDAALDTLTLPDSPLLTIRERRMAMQAEKKAAQQRNFLAVGLVAVAAIAADTGLGYLHSQHMEEFQFKNVTLQSKESELKQLTQRKLVRHPDQTQTLNTIYQIGSGLAGESVTGKFAAHEDGTAVLVVETSPSSIPKMQQLTSKGINSRFLNPEETEIFWSNHADI